MENLRFVYDTEKDIRCLLDWGKSSNNSQVATLQYTQLIARYGENPSVDDTRGFIEEYCLERKIDRRGCVEKFQNEWNKVAGEYHKKARQVFGVSLPGDITAYLTINSRCPYDINGGYFLVSMSAQSGNVIAMHELWHFYTWYGIGIGEEERIGKAKYNELKESLTVLLNEECGDLYPEGMTDLGYPQHAQRREKILELWRKKKDVRSFFGERL